MHIIRVPEEAETAFLQACEGLRELLDAPEDGPLASEVCRSATDAGHWVIIHEWLTLDDFHRLQGFTLAPVARISARGEEYVVKKHADRDKHAARIQAP
jgi:heme-degrading monooxygenase HmoA